MAARSMPRLASVRVILALMLREMTTRYGKSFGGYLWAFAEPVGMIAMLSLVFSFAVRTPPLGSNFPMFFATGFLSYLYFMEMAQFSSSAVNMNRPLLEYPRVTPIDAIIARVLLQFVTLSVVTVVILGGIIWYFDIHTIYDFRAILEAIALSTLLGVGTGVTNVFIFTVFPTYKNIWKIITRPLFLISGILFLLESMPPFVQSLLWWNPLIHITALMHTGFYPSYDALFVSKLYVASIGGGLLVLGMFLVITNRSTIAETQ